MEYFTSEIEWDAWTVFVSTQQHEIDAFGIDKGILNLISSRILGQREDYRITCQKFQETNQADFCYYYAYDLGKRQEEDIALEFAKAAVDISNDTYNVRLFIASTLSMHDQNEKAFKEYIKIANLYPSSQAFIETGKCAMRLKKYSEAVRFYTKAYQQCQNDSELCVFLGFAHFRNHHPEKAIEYLQKAVQLESDNPFCWHNLGLFLLKGNHHLEALEAFHKVRHLSPDYTDIDRHITLALRSLENYRFYHRFKWYAPKTWITLKNDK